MKVKGRKKYAKKESPKMVAEKRKILKQKVKDRIFNLKSERLGIGRNEIKNEEASDDEKVLMPVHSVLNDVRNKQHRQDLYNVIKKRRKGAKKALKRIEEAESKAEKREEVKAARLAASMKMEEEAMDTDSDTSLENPDKVADEAILKGVEQKVKKKKKEKKIPHTIESKRKKDVTMVDNDDEDLLAEESTDAYAAYYAKTYEPKVLIATTSKVNGKTIRFIHELCRTLPNSKPLYRKANTVEALMKGAALHGFTDLLIVNEDHRSPNGILLIHLPNGPTAYFRISNLRLCKDLRKKAKDMTGHRPEVILNNFKTRLGRGIARMIGALYHYEPEYTGRSVCTFHNQRDFIFFRHHRYEFKLKGKKRARLQELGPRFTLKLQWLLDGAFNGDYEWTLKRHQMEQSRTTFQL